MSLQTLARDALTTLKALSPSSIVAVVSGGVSAQGLSVGSTANTSPTDYGEQGITTGVVYVDASAFAQPERGATITVGGRSVFVTECRVDPVGAMYKIDYGVQRPVEGV